MSFFVKYAIYPEKIEEVRMELGSSSQYQTIQAVEILPTDEVEEDTPKQYEIEFKVIDNSSNSITTHKMSRAELGDYIAVLKQFLAQTK